MIQGPTDMTTNHFHPEDCVCFNMRRTARIVTQAYDRALKPAAIQANQFSLLAALHKAGDDDGIRLGALAEILGLDRTTLTRNLNPALRAGWLQVVEGQDRRERLVALTEAGQAKLIEALPLWRQAQEQTLGRLGRSKSAALMDLARQLTAG